MTKLNSWVMWFLASAFYAYQYVLRVLPNIMMPDIMAKYNIEAALFGQFSGIYYLGYAGMHIPIGLMLDRVGPRIVLPLCMLLAVAGLSPLIWTDVWIYPTFGRLLIGAGSSGAILGVFKIIQMCFSSNRFTLMLGVSVTIGLIGAIYGGQPVHYLLQTFGWEQVIQIICVIGLMMAAAMFILIPSYQNNFDETVGILAAVKTIFFQPKTILICILGGMMVGPLEGFADVWGTEYLKTVYGIETDIAAGLPSYIYLGMCFGSPVLSYIADKTQNYFAVVITAAIIMLICFALILTGALSYLSLIIAFIIIGIMCAYQIPVIYMASQTVHKQIRSLTTAMVNMIIMTFGYVFHSSIGKILNILWDNSMIGDIPVYSSFAYTTALLIIPAGLIIGTIGFGWLYRSEQLKLKNAYQKL